VYIAPVAADVNVQHGPIISLDFDDGFESAYQLAEPIIHAAGYRTTQYIITHALGEKNYMTVQQVLAMQAAGDEIGAHTQTHPHLTDIPLAQAQTEITGSKQDLLDMGVTSVTTFAYPYGSHNAAIEGLVKNAGFIDARITGPGFNDANTDPYALYYFGIFASTTPAMVESAIDTVAKNKKWLIIVFHRVDETPISAEDTSHQLVQEFVDYIHQKNIPVVTNAEGLKIMKHIF
jgi:peptidoglycan/xylan/chitin deacetylase (PgdA/CDA1 family)